MDDKVVQFPRRLAVPGHLRLVEPEPEALHVMVIRLRQAIWWAEEHGANAVHIKINDLARLLKAVENPTDAKD